MLRKKEKQKRTKEQQTKVCLCANRRGSIQKRGGMRERESMRERKYKRKRESMRERERL